MDAVAGLYAVFLLGAQQGLCCGTRGAGLRSRAPRAGLLLAGVATGSVLLASGRPLTHFFVEYLSDAAPPSTPLAAGGGAAKAD